MRIQVSKIKANPFRHIEKYPIEREKVEALKTSIKETEFWDNILIRENQNTGKYELAYGHHRLQAIKELGIKEIDAPVKDLDDATMLRIMANENMDSWKSNPGVVNETVRAAKKFIDDEMAKYDSWGASNESIRSLFTDQHGFDTTKGKGAGQTVILKFLGGNWKQWMIQESLAIIKDENEGTLSRNAVESLPDMVAVKAFRKEVKDLKVPIEEQVELADKINENKDSVSRRNIEASVLTHERKKDKAEIEKRFPKPPKDTEIEALILSSKNAIRRFSELDTDLSKLNKLGQDLNLVTLPFIEGLELRNSIASHLTVLSRVCGYVNIDINWSENK